MKAIIDIHLTKEIMPERNKTVIISGGLGVWTGSTWLKQSGVGVDCYEIFNVEWWGELITNISYLNKF